MNQESKEGKQENTSPPSLSSSPSHEFSFTISLHHTQNQSKSSVSNNIDLSPADEIFFHGHLLPLHLLSHLPHSPPRASTNSLDNFTLPITQPILHDYQNPNNNHSATKGTTVKPKSFSLFGLPKWRKGCEVNEKEDNGRCKKRPKFDVTYLVKKYARAIMSIRGRKSSNEAQYYRHQSYSCSDFSNARLGGKKELRGRFSAPASMRTSPTNSGLIAAKESATNYNTSDSTMEELQAAIQAAIAHCKNSVSMEEKINCQAN